MVEEEAPIANPGREELTWNGEFAPMSPEASVALVKEILNPNQKFKI